MRGEKRGKYRKGEERSIGDCIDCHQCVAVCPTGIDIRNGTQLECVNCTACIDACDHIMDRVGLPRGLITFASEKGIAERKPLKFTLRIAAYSAVLIALVGILSFALISRTDTETTILRTPGMMYQENADGTVSNLYNYKVNNKTFKDLPIEFRVEELDAKIKIIGKDSIHVKKESASTGTMFIYIPANQIEKRSTKIQIGIYSNGELIEKVKTSFLGPVN